MILRRRHKRKTAQALDAVASVTKVWSDWQLCKRAGKGVAKAKELRPPSKIKALLCSKWVRIGGALALAGGAAAAVAAKLKGDDPQVYSPPSPVEPVAADPPQDEPAPIAVAPDPVKPTTKVSDVPEADEPASDADAKPAKPTTKVGDIPEADAKPAKPTTKLSDIPEADAEPAKATKATKATTKVSDVPEADEPAAGDEPAAEE